MFGILLSGLIAVAPVIATQQDQLFEEAHGWRVFKTPQGCVGFFKMPGAASVSAFYPNSRDALTLIIHADNVPRVSEVKETIFLRAGRTEWGPADAKAQQESSGLPGIIFNVRRTRALAEFGRADVIAITKRFNPPRVIPLVAVDKAADMLGRCVG